MKMQKVFIAIVVVIAGFMTQSCEKEIVKVPSVPAESHSVMTLGEYNNGKYQIPSSGITYISKSGVAIYYCETRPNNGEKIYEEIFSPRRSIGVENADWKVGDTVTWVSVNPEQIIRIEGNLEVIEFVESIEVVVPPQQ